MECQGFAAATYDLYVLGLLDSDERATIDSHVKSKCPACIPGVQRSMNLWLVFASTLEDREWAQDFKARLLEVAELGERVLTFPLIQEGADRSRGFRWLFAGIGVVVAVGLVIIGWDARRASATIARRGLEDQITLLNRRFADTRAQLEIEKSRRQQAEALVQSAGRGAAVGELENVRAKLSIAQAQASQYRALLDRRDQIESENDLVLSALKEPGVRMFSMKEASNSRIGPLYLLIVPKLKLLIIGSNLSPPPAGKQYQVWVMSKRNSQPVSAGVVRLDEDRSVFFENDDASLTADVISVAVTLEPEGGSSAPSGAQLLAANTT